MTASYTPPRSAPVEHAYHACEETTHRAAANFYYGIRLLPPSKRRAVSAVYAFARRVDDVGDGSLPTAQKLALLATERERIARLRRSDPDRDDAISIALADACLRFDLPLGACDALIDGVEQDVRGARFATFADLLVYCGRVAGSIGRLCVAIFGARDLPAALARADELGVAMQLTNILRDVREDRAVGRLYLPYEDLARYGCGEHPLDAPPDALAQLIRFEAARTRDWFARGLELLPLLDRRSSSCVLAMTGIYRHILDRIEEDPLEVTRHRISLPAWEKATLAVRSVMGAGT